MKSSKFLDIFPPPQFLDVPFASLVFSDSHIRVLHLDKSTSHPDFCKESELPKGIIESGIIKKKEELVKILTDLALSLKTPFIKFAVSDQISYVFTAKVPVIAGKDARESVSFILEENVPLPLADISFDFTVIGIERKEGGLTANVSVSAVSSSIIKSYIECIRSAGMEAIFCSNESQAIARSVIPDGEKGHSAIVYAHRDTVSIFLALGQVIEFSSFVQLPPNSSEELFASFVNTEFVKAFNYWRENYFLEEKYSKGSPMRCFICGTHDACASIARVLSKTPNISVALGNVWTNVFSLNDYIPEISFDDSLRFGGAIGLFLK